MPVPSQPLPTSPAVPQTGHAWLQRFIVAVVLTAALALAVVIVPLFALKPGSSPSTTPLVSVTAAAGTFSTVPTVPPAQRRGLAAGLETFLASLYDRAFSNVVTTTKASPSASPDPIAGIGQMFSPRALDALRSHLDAFVPPDGLRVYDGRVSFDGVATVDAGQQTQAFLDISFVGKGRMKGAPVELLQQGSMLLVHTPGGWRVAGFDLTMTAASVPPSGSPRSSRAMHVAP